MKSPMRKNSRPSWSLQQRLDHQSVRDPETGCILWKGSRGTDGYGVLRIAGKQWRARRAAWTAKNGPIPAGLYVCHRCNVRNCINPDHLLLGTAKDNSDHLWGRLGHEARVKGQERRPSKAPEIISFAVQGQKFTFRLLNCEPTGARIPSREAEQKKQRQP